MNIVRAFSALTAHQRNIFFVALLGWALDAFDFFILPFVVGSIALEFHADISHVLLALTLTLACRPIGALIFGMLGDRFGRRNLLIVDVALFALFELLSGFAPTLTSFLVLRAFFGIAMGGEWGLGSALAMETLPVESRGLFSGILQQGYALGYLLAAAVYGLCFATIGWRGMFFIGACPALLAFFIRAKIPSDRQPQTTQLTGQLLPPSPAPRSRVRGFGLFIYATLLMTGFTAMSHGTQDLYPLFLREQHGLSIGACSQITIIANLGAILGGIFFGGLSQRIGRRKGIVAAVLLGLLLVPLWSGAATPLLLALGGFSLQFAVQGAWGIVPAHLNELAPATRRATFTGLVAQLGNLLSSGIAQGESLLAHGVFRLDTGTSDYGRSLALVANIVFFAVGVLAWLGPERRSATLTLPPSEEITT